MGPLTVSPSRGHQGRTSGPPPEFPGVRCPGGEGWGAASSGTRYKSASVNKTFVLSFNYRNAGGQVPLSHFQLEGTKLSEVQRLLSVPQGQKGEQQLQNQVFPLQADAPLLPDGTRQAGRVTVAASVMAGMDSRTVTTA